MEKDFIKDGLTNEDIIRTIKEIIIFYCKHLFFYKLVNNN